MKGVQIRLRLAEKKEFEALDIEKIASKTLAIFNIVTIIRQFILIWKSNFMGCDTQISFSSKSMASFPYPKSTSNLAFEN